MPAATMTGQGQIAMPRAVGESLGLQPADRVGFIPLDKRGCRVIALLQDMSSVRGRSAGRAAPPVRLRQMARAVEAEAAERAPGFVSPVVLIKCCRVLERMHGASPAERLNSRQLAEAQRAGAAAALSLMGSGGGDIADALIVEIANRSGCRRNARFEKKVGRLGMNVLTPITAPASTSRS